MTMEQASVTWFKETICVNMALVETHVNLARNSRQAIELVPEGSFKAVKQSNGSYISELNRLCFLCLKGSN